MFMLQPSSRLAQRHVYRDNQPAISMVMQGNIAMMHIDYFLDDRQTQARATTATGNITLREGLKHSFHLIFRDTRTVVTDLQINPLTVAFKTGRYFNVAVAVTQRILQQIIQQTLNRYPP